MSGWWSQDFLCMNEACRVRFDEVVKREEKDQPLKCPACGSQADPVMGIPNLMVRALPDGTNRGASWDRQKDIAKLQKQRKNLRHDKRGEIDKEIGKLQKEQLKK